MKMSFDSRSSLNIIYNIKLFLSYVIGIKLSISPEIFLVSPKYFLQLIFF